MRVRIRSSWCLLFVLSLAAGAVQAAGVAAARKQIEASMLVTGRVTITLDGAVAGWTIDEREKLPEVVANLVDAAVPGWRFEPIVVDGKPAHGSARMSLLLVANRFEDGRFRVSIRDGYFGREAVNIAAQLAREGAGAADDAAGASDQLSALDLQPPAYPMRALAGGAHGTVYVVVKVNRDGRVEDAAVEQVNLRVVGSGVELARMREILAKPALAAARKWTFRPPSTGEWADDESWTARVPVDYRFYDSRPAGYGQWEAYVPGPRSPVPWQMESLDGFEIAPDALIAGQVHQAGTGLKLLTPIGGG
ncbi:energy transducer TonB [Luteimonas saliphila]|uniref:energy transducer TonB n=1 Tax=Luteimonas saliphila TaxID=2804919 RepID=UPI00192E2E3F|nr:energy transducer TonB [Luteimonas saliphila]